MGMSGKKVIQIGILVRDIGPVTKAWAAILNRPVPVPALTDGYETTHAVYRGEPCRGRILQTVFRLDDLEIELIAPANEEPSYWRECLDRDGEGLHHIAFAADDMEGAQEALRSLGYETVQSGIWKDTPEDGRYAFIDTREALKCTVELLRHPKKEQNREEQV